MKTPSFLLFIVSHTLPHSSLLRVWIIKPCDISTMVLSGLRVLALKEIVANCCNVTKQPLSWHPLKPLESVGQCIWSHSSHARFQVCFFRPEIPIDFNIFLWCYCQDDWFIQVKDMWERGNLKTLKLTSVGVGHGESCMHWALITNNIQ